MDKNKWILIVVGIVVVLLLFNKPREVKTSQKLAGEVISWSTTSSINTGATLTITATPNSMTAITGWTAEGIAIPTGWALQSAVFSGGSGMGGQGCAVESGVLNCAAAGSTPADVPTTLTIKFTAPASATNPVTFSGSYTTTATDKTIKSGVLSSLIVSFQQNCGSGSCTGTQTYSGGVWGTCSSSNNDCGTCCKCSSTGAETYDSTQNGDCSSSTCAADGCGLGGCGIHIFSDYPASVSNICSALKSCTTNTCTAACTTDTDSDTYAGIIASYLNCYDCDNSNVNVNPSKTEVCNNNIDDNCDTTNLMGLTTGGLDQYADVDCSQGYTFAEFKGYLIAWATSDAVTFKHSITFAQLKGVLLYWASN